MMIESFAIQSYCFRNFKDNAEVAALIRECGSTEIELCGVHVNFSDESTFNETVKVYGDAGVAIVSIGVAGIGKDAGAARKLFEFAKIAGASHMSVDFGIGDVPESYRIAEALAEEYDVYLGIHNHGGRHWLGCPAVLEHAFTQTTKRVGLSLDTAWALHSHADPIEMINQFSERLYLLHLKDFVFDRSGAPEDVVCGSGNLDLKRMMEALRTADFNGPAIIEYEGDAEDPVPALKQCMAELNKHL